MASCDHHNNDIEQNENYKSFRKCKHESGITEAMLQADATSGEPLKATDMQRKYWQMQGRESSFTLVRAVVARMTSPTFTPALSPWPPSMTWSTITLPPFSALSQTPVTC